MKSLYFFYTKARMYLTLVPLIFVFAVAIRYNPTMSGLMKLYPLIFASGGGIIFIIIYLFRIVRFNTEEIRSIGPYSSKEFCTLESGKTLVITMRNRRKMKLEVFGKNDRSVYGWSEGEEEHEINLYRDIVSGGVGALKRIFTYLGVDIEDINSLISSDSLTLELENFTVKKYVTDDGDTYSVYFKVTL